MYRFRFYHMGEWIDIIIDDQLPYSKTTAKPRAAKPQRCALSGDEEYWVPLVEKAYAKFFGGYKNIISGDPIWALFNVTGGVTFEVRKLKGTLSFDLFEFLHRIQDEALFATSNTKMGRRASTKSEDICEMGLVNSHAYAMLELASVTFV